MLAKLPHPLCGEAYSAASPLHNESEERETWVGAPTQRQQHRGSQKAQAAHEVDIKGRRAKIVAITRKGKGAAVLAQAGVVDGDAHQTAGTIGQGPAPHASERRLGLPACGPQQGLSVVSWERRA